MDTSSGARTTRENRRGPAGAVIVAAPPGRSRGRRTAAAPAARRGTDARRTAVSRSCGRAFLVRCGGAGGRRAVRVCGLRGPWWPNRGRIRPPRAGSSDVPTARPPCSAARSPHHGWAEGAGRALGGFPRARPAGRGAGFAGSSGPGPGRRPGRGTHRTGRCPGCRASPGRCPARSPGNRARRRGCPRSASGEGTGRRHQQESKQQQHGDSFPSRSRSRSPPPARAYPGGPAHHGTGGCRVATAVNAGRSPRRLCGPCASAWRQLAAR